MTSNSERQAIQWGNIQLKILTLKSVEIHWNPRRFVEISWSFKITKAIEQKLVLFCWSTSSETSSYVHVAARISPLIAVINLFDCCLVMSGCLITNELNLIQLSKKVEESEKVSEIESWREREERKLASKEDSRASWTTVDYRRRSRRANEL